MIRVRATEKGQSGGRIREEGEVFDVESKDKLAHWMEIVPAQQPVVHDAGPDTVQEAGPGSADSQQDPVHDAPGAEAGTSEVNGPGTTLSDVNQKAIDQQSGGGNEFLK